MRNENTLLTDPNYAAIPHVFLPARCDEYFFLRGILIVRAVVQALVRMSI